MPLKPPPPGLHLLGCPADRGGRCGCGAEGYERRVAILTLENEMADMKWQAPSGHEVDLKVCGQADVVEGPAASRDVCPRCGAELQFDEVDVGVGTLRGNPWCPECHWTPDDQSDGELGGEGGTA